MKQNKRGMVCFLILVMALCYVTPVLADTLNQVTVMVDGETLGTKGVIVNERTLVPVRALAEALGATVEWDEAERKVTLSKLIYEINRTSDEASVNTRNVYLWIDKLEASVNGSAVSLDVAPQIIDSITMLPARAVCEWFDATVEWDEGSQTVMVTKGANESFSDARYENAETDLAEQDAINRAISDGQGAVAEAIEESGSWITESKLNDDLVIFIYGDEALLTEQEVGFYRYGSSTGSVGSLLYAVPDFDESLHDGETKTYSGVTIKKESGVLHFKKTELQGLGILP